MSGGGVGQGAVYSPLPQTISDTDSSEEELNNIIHHNDSRKFIVTNKDSADKHNGSCVIVDTPSVIYGKKMGEYRQLGHDGEGEVCINGLPNRDHATADDIPIIKPDGPLPRHLESMSPLRKVCFVFSILLCGLTVIVFLWVLPCDWATCPSMPLKSGSRSWETTLQGLELKGKIGVVAGVPGRGHNLVFLARGDVINAALGKSEIDPNMKTFPPNGGGLISLLGSSGKVAWYIPFNRLPTDMDCSLLDMTNDGAQDCIIIGPGKLLVAVEPITGSIIWYVHSHNGTLGSPVDMDFPLVLPDLDGDGVNDLLTTCSFNRSTQMTPTITQRNNLIFISGAKGMIIGDAYTISNCPHISGLDVDKDYIYYICQGTMSPTNGKMPVQDLYFKATNKQLNVSTYIQNRPLKQHQAFGITNKITKEVSNRHLTLLNEGSCPNQCNVTVRVIDKRDGESTWGLIQENTYGMIPVVLSFKTHSASGGNMVEPVNGFVLKFWTWISGSNHVVNPALRGIDNNSMSSNALFRSRLKRSAPSSAWEEGGFSHRYHRSVKPALEKKTPQVVVHQLKERVVLYTFNTTDFHIVNASLHDITQLCYPDQLPANCQPDQSFQEQSLLIADLDQDGSQELISYLTTFTSSDLDGTSADLEWHLQSRVRVVRLEAELPKLYEAVARQVENVHSGCVIKI